ncbi:hypothetical protein M758_4G268300 [Ceratodon purpureus]|nr:hypothetical protein M758_4G268300 [Ceratodon purpureus]
MQVPQKTNIALLGRQSTSFEWSASIVVNCCLDGTCGERLAGVGSSAERNPCGSFTGSRQVRSSSGESQGRDGRATAELTCTFGAFAGLQGARTIRTLKATRAMSRTEVLLSLLNPCLVQKILGEINGMVSGDSQCGGTHAFLSE